ncbi:MAG TPA: tetratricopeptide repeat protein [Pyrinomonadaceae bacterium]|nr:tetratricopeptide repeat protein [Pyrinomonadaceae bacterium]
MKHLISLSQVVAFLVVVLLTISSVEAKISHNKGAVLNTIQGMVWDPYNQPVSDVYVELQNELGMTLSRQRTTNSGRFVFTGLSSGSFKVTVLTYGTDYLQQTQDVQIVNLTRTMSDQAFVEFHLKYDPRKITLGSGGVPEEVFVQEGISDEARKHYRKGVELLAGKKDKGLTEIERALQISPNYFDALNRLGNEYVQRKEYRKAVPHLIKAIDINQRSFSSFYALAYAAHQLGHKPEAVEAARAATIIKPASVNGQVLYGTVLRVNGNYDRAEKALLQAKTLSKKPVPEVHWQLALLYNKLGRNREAAEQLETYLKVQPDGADKKEIQDLIAKLRTQASK